MASDPIAVSHALEASVWWERGEAAVLFDRTVHSGVQQQPSNLPS